MHLTAGPLSDPQCKIGFFAGLLSANDIWCPKSSVSERVDDLRRGAQAAVPSQNSSSNEMSVVPYRLIFESPASASGGIPLASTTQGISCSS